MVEAETGGGRDARDASEGIGMLVMGGLELKERCLTFFLSTEEYQWKMAKRRTSKKVRQTAVLSRLTILTRRGKSVST